MIVVDTGPLVAATISDDADHERCVGEFKRLHDARRELLIPSFVAAEVCYMISRFGGAAPETAFLHALESDVFTLVELTKPDLSRVAALVERYADFPLGAVDASVVAVAERLKITEVFTLDVRHFAAVRPAHVPAFTLLPG
ncbi:PIN domain-containing protein [Microbispora bryophytorum]|uniref:type II toxin-antitoxin system VapC family toxin n=1 Tax=Microbispora bryophytorum TaxID=1460882 RepID=UPI0033E3F676